MDSGRGLRLNSRKGNEMNQNGYHPQGMQGFDQKNNNLFPNNHMNYQGYPPTAAGQGQASPEPYRQQTAQGYTPASYQQGQPTPPYTQNPYTAQNIPQGAPQNQQLYSYGYPQPGQPGPQAYPTGGYTMPPQQNTGGSFIPQTPYSPGYTSPGYQPPQQNGYQAPQGSYQAGYSPYNQMGRIPPQGDLPPEQTAGIPLNGGGYVPQKVPVRRRPFEFKDWHLIAAGAVLLVLFVVSVLITKNATLKIAMILLSAATAGFLWIRPITAENRRLTYTVFALALCLLTAVSFIFGQPKDTTRNSAGTGTQASTTAKSQAADVPEIPSQSQATAKTADTANQQAALQYDDLMTRLVSFFTYWAENRQDEMLELCAPSWKAKQENARTKLFGLLQNRRPLDCTPESISGTEADTSRRVTLTSTISRNNNKDPEKFRMSIVMVKENNEWYIDPNSLQTNEHAETPDPNVTPTPAPTPTAAVYSSTLLYYNPNKGEYYHLDPNCKTVGAKYVPLQGKFTYAEINTEPFSKLKPCNVCGAPLREQ